MLEAAQPTPPTVADFVTVLRGVIDPQTATGASSKLFGQIFKDKEVAGKPKGSVGVHKSSIKLALEFEAVRNAMGETGDSLDRWFADLAYFTLEPSSLFEDPAKQQQCIEERKTLCGNDAKLRTYKPGSFRTYINGLAKVYNDSAAANHFVTSSQSRFPELNDLLAACVARFRVIESIESIEEEDTPLLCDEELMQLYDATDLSNDGEAQRYNIIVLGYRTGFRPDNLKKLHQ